MSINEKPGFRLGLPMLFWIFAALVSLVLIIGGLMAKQSQQQQPSAVPTHEDRMN